MTVAADAPATVWPSASAVRTVTGEEATAFRRVARSVVDPSGATPAAAAGPSPVHATVLTSAVAADAVRELLGAADPLPIPVHLSDEIRIHRPLRVGEQLLVSVDVVGARPDRRGGRLALRSRLTIAGGAAVAEVLTTVLLLGDLALVPFGHVPLQQGNGGACWTDVVCHDIPADLPSRYAAVSGSDHAIHLRRSAARAAGFPDVVVQGMGIVALACEEIVDRYAGGDPTRVRTVGARFAGPVAPGDRLDISLSPAVGGVVHFRCTTRRGVAVRRAWVELDRNQRGGAA